MTMQVLRRRGLQRFSNLEDLTSFSTSSLHPWVPSLPFYGSTRRSLTFSRATWNTVGRWVQDTLVFRLVDDTWSSDESGISRHRVREREKVREDTVKTTVKVHVYMEQSVELQIRIRGSSWRIHLYIIPDAGAPWTLLRDTWSHPVSGLFFASLSFQWTYLTFWFFGVSPSNTPIHQLCFPLGLCVPSLLDRWSRVPR